MENLARALASDLDKAFAELVCELQHGVFSGILQLTGDHHRAQDLTQEAFIRAYLALRTYPSERIRSMRLRGWVWTIALNLLRNQIRSQTLRPVPVRLEDAGYIPTEPPPTPRLATQVGAPAFHPAAGSDPATCGGALLSGDIGSHRPSPQHCQKRCPSWFEPTTCHHRTRTLRGGKK